MIEHIVHQDRLFAIIIRSSYTNVGAKFFTPKELSQQVSYLHKPKGFIEGPHLHQPIVRSVTLTQEVLFIRSGSVQVDFYDDETPSYLDSRILEKGDVILLAAGGHGFTMLEDSEMIEVKQGPYAGEMDKIYIQESVTQNEVTA